MQLQALGHTVRLMPPAYVKPYARGQDASNRMARFVYCHNTVHFSGSVLGIGRSTFVLLGLISPQNGVPDPHDYDDL